MQTQSPSEKGTEAEVHQKLSSKAGVIQLYRYPGLSDSALHTLLRKVRLRLHARNVPMLCRH